MKKLFFIFSIVFCFSLIGAPIFDFKKIVDNFRLDTWMTAIPSKKNISLWEGLEEHSSRTLPLQYESNGLFVMRLKVE